MGGNDMLVLFSGVSALAAVAAAVFAALSVTGTRADSRARTRPVMVAQLRRAPLSHGGIYLQLKNYGESLAKDVRVTFEPALPTELTPGASLPFIGRRYASPIACIPPGMVLSNVYKAAPTDQDQPEDLAVCVTYQASDGKTYKDRFELSTTLLGLETESTPSDSNDKSLRSIKAIEAIARGVHES